MNKRTITIIAVVAVVVIVVGVGSYYAFMKPTTKPQPTPDNTGKTLTETGSTLLYPIFNVWKGNYTNATISTAGTGSGAGISGAIAGTVNIGASDAFMTDTEVTQNPNMLNIPILISSQYVAYNLPNNGSYNFTQHPLVLSGPVVADIYSGTIKNWNDPKIAALNPGVPLPDHTIVTVHRSDGSGDTNMFTLFLSKSSSSWNSSVGYGTSVSWPSAPDQIAGQGNSGVINQMASNQYSIGYIAMTYHSDIKTHDFGAASLLNKAGNVVNLSVANVTTAAQQFLPDIPKDGRIAIAFAPGATSYPIATLEYVIIKQNQPTSNLAIALRQFMTWIVSPYGGSQAKYLDPLLLSPLPSQVVWQIVLPLINKISTQNVTAANALTETGSTLLYPIFNVWKGNYTNATISTAGTGSGAGISGAIAGTVNIGASDAFMTDTQLQGNPGMLNIPILISSQYVAYNIPNNGTYNFTQHPIVLSGPVIADIYNGTVTNWNDPKIAALNPGVPLPDHTIVTVHRSDGSGDTNMFTLFLSKSSSSWNDTVGYGTSVSWPSAPDQIAGQGNSGVINQMASNPYSIGYIAMTYHTQIQQKGFGSASLLNKAGNVVNLSVDNVSAAAQQFLPDIPKDGRIAIAFAPGATSYPIATLEYVIIKQNQTSLPTSIALRQLLTWIVSPYGGSQSQYINPLLLSPLPSQVVWQIVLPIIENVEVPT